MKFHWYSYLIFTEVNKAPGYFPAAAKLTPSSVLVSCRCCRLPKYGKPATKQPGTFQDATGAGPRAASGRGRAGERGHGHLSTGAKRRWIGASSVALRHRMATPCRRRRHTTAPCPGPRRRFLQRAKDEESRAVAAPKCQSGLLLKIISFRNKPIIYHQYFYYQSKSVPATSHAPYVTTF